MVVLKALRACLALSVQSVPSGLYSHYVRRSDPNALFLTHCHTPMTNQFWRTLVTELDPENTVANMFQNVADDDGSSAQLQSANKYDNAAPLVVNM